MVVEKLPELIKQLKDIDPEKRRRAIFALKSLGSEARDALPAIREAMKDPDWYVASLAAELIYLLKNR